MTIFVIQLLAVGALSKFTSDGVLVNLPDASNHVKAIMPYLVGTLIGACWGLVT